ncbi:MAG: acylneuraminate cytidylyltransferase family protein [Bacteriovoracaceae bacterium]|jgi:CMP-N-acetylneuraminic acid synthetase|nr:acylneuraminate cytidylyltransferase family protein [Bacteriovoracaceae bacterium]
MKKCIAIICCRGGSKGIPGKNIKDFFGKPLLGWIIEEAKKADVFEEIILSTDSEEIAEVGKKYGCTVPVLRPAEIAGDSANQFDSHAHMFDYLNVDDETHIVCNLNNNPFINSPLIKRSHDLFIENNSEVIVLDTVKIPGDYIYFRQSFEHKGRMRFQFAREFGESQINRQTVGPTFSAINNIRWGRPSYLRSYDNFKCELVEHGFIPVDLPKLRNFDLDDLADWEIAEAVMDKLIKMGE